jgi:hypothetical protein
MVFLLHPLIFAVQVVGKPIDPQAKAGILLETPHNHVMPIREMGTSAGMVRAFCKIRASLKD